MTAIYAGGAAGRVLGALAASGIGIALVLPVVSRLDLMGALTVTPDRRFARGIVQVGRRVLGGP